MNMKKIIMAAIAMLTLVGCKATPKTITCEAQPTAEEPQNIVVYFSATGTTARVAKQLAEEKNAVLWEIIPAEPYTEADLDWRNKQSRSSIEMADPEARPTIKMCTDLTPYSEVWLGFPIWWGVCPRIIDSWLENNVEMLEGKPIHLFATSGGSAVEPALEYLKEGYPSLNFSDAQLLN